jgi:predicted O-linked N-acetylglucosamine transferase (SPINDLY family)
VGYVSPDFFTHSVSYFAEAPLTHHTTPARQHSSSSGSGLFQHYAYCCAPKRDNKTSRLRASVEAAGGVW